MEIDEVLNSPGFWILAAIGISAELLGFIYARRNLDVSMPLWQLIVTMLVTLVAAAFFATKD